MGLHDRHLISRELVGLGQNGSRDANLSDVVQKTANGQYPDQITVKLEMSCEQADKGTDCY